AVADEPGDRGDVDDAPGAARRHLREGALAAVERPGEVDRDDALEDGRRQLVDAGVAVEDPRRVHHDRERAEPANRRRDGAVDVGPAADVAGDEERPAALGLDRLDGVLPAVGQEVEDRHGRARGAERHGDRAPDPRAATGDEGRAGDETHRPTNSATAAAATSGVSWSTMWPPDRSESAAPLMRCCQASAYTTGFARSASPQRTSVGAAIRCRRFLIPLSGIGQTNFAIAARRWMDSICAARFSSSLAGPA